jgi:hypothetical protein
MRALSKAHIAPRSLLYSRLERRLGDQDVAAEAHDLIRVARTVERLNFVRRAKVVDRWLIKNGG